MLRGALLIALAAVSWGTTGSVSTLLATHAGAHPLLVGALRMAVAAAVLLLAAAAARPAPAIAPRDRFRCLATGACMAAYQAAYFTAVALSGIAVTAVVAICSAPLMIAVLAAGLLGERLTRRTALALVLGVGGTALLVAGPGPAAAPSPDLVAGVLLALVAGLAYALYVIVTKVSLASSAPLPLTAATFTVAAILLAPVLAWVDAPLRQIALGWPWLLYLGGVATAGAYAAYSRGLGHVPATLAGVITLLEPLTASLLGVAVFGERLGLLGAAGAALLLAGLVLALTPARVAPAPVSRPAG